MVLNANLKCSLKVFVYLSRGTLGALIRLRMFFWFIHFLISKLVCTFNFVQDTIVRKIENQPLILTSRNLVMSEP